MSLLEWVEWFGVSVVGVNDDYAREIVCLFVIIIIGLELL